MAKTITRRDFRMTFGKYKGKTIEEVLSLNPSYLRWADLSVVDFKLSSQLLIAVAEACPPPRTGPYAEFDEEEEYARGDAFETPF